jgi:adenylosuccinate lyase
MDSAIRVKEIESTINHDVKAVEYFIKERMKSLGLERYSEFVHFGLTSQDVNNTAIPLMIKESLINEYLPLLDRLQNELRDRAGEWEAIPMLARTHGQPASPTRLGKEIRVFHERLSQQRELLRSIPIPAKFGGATGNFNAHHLAFPEKDWYGFGKNLVESVFGLHYSFPTTQIEHYDHLAALFDTLKRINTVLIDFCRDLWTYVSMDYFKQHILPGEVGSSAMPHKVNPIDFENAEGNLGMANALFGFLADKLPISRLQRDLTDSTVLRNVGVPFAHSILSFMSISKGLSKLEVNRAQLEKDLENNWSVVAEGIQTILRREGFPRPYEALKELTRVGEQIDQKHIHEFIDSLDVTEEVRTELKRIRPDNYTGI